MLELHGMTWVISGVFMMNIEKQGTLQMLQKVTPEPTRRLRLKSVWSITQHGEILPESFKEKIFFW